ncbi:hypothetical protein [Phocaeicola dorei]|uniref:hypothetical protein n=1 Tax=Phocaeicola dorei TaxID=357276 RepID=UPI001FBBAF74|nr:hypothetical protein [Phocaeicola dorei]
MRFIPSATRSRCSYAKVACGFDGIGKVERQKPFRAESSSNGVERIPPENLATASHTLERHPATETSD